MVLCHRRIQRIHRRIGEFGFKKRIDARSSVVGAGQVKIRSVDEQGEGWRHIFIHRFEHTPCRNAIADQRREAGRLFQRVRAHCPLWEDTDWFGQPPWMAPPTSKTTPSERQVRCTKFLARKKGCHPLRHDKRRTGKCKVNWQKRPESFLLSGCCPFFRSNQSLSPMIT